jgi:hypothetical protein
MAIIKTEEEIEKLRRAALLGDKCFEHICNCIKPGMTEKMIAQEMNDFFMKNGASALSFDTIVGAGKNSAFIHSTPTDNIIQEQDIILLDFGCILDGFCSDTSRTIFVGGITDKQKEINYIKSYSIESINDIIKKAKEDGCLVSYNHPVWSMQTYEDYIGLKGLWGVEWHNTGCVNSAYKDTFQPIEDLLRKGENVFPLATDEISTVLVVLPTTTLIV